MTLKHELCSSETQVKPEAEWVTTLKWTESQVALARLSISRQFFLANSSRDVWGFQRQGRTKEAKYGRKPPEVKDMRPQPAGNSHASLRVRNEMPYIPR